ncbi:uncharacterized mitochondrial protein-like protein, partial [Tanacetum coccineum]
MSLSFPAKLCRPCGSPSAPIDLCCPLAKVVHSHIFSLTKSEVKDTRINMAIYASFIGWIVVERSTDWKHVQFVSFAFVYRIFAKLKAFEPRVSAIFLEKGKDEGRMMRIISLKDYRSAFLYGTIEEEVYVTQPPGFKDPDHPDKVYKVVKALYGLHQAPRAWYETLVYVDDIILGFINKELCTGFEKLMKDKFQMSSIGELTFFLGLQVQQKEDGIFISQDKYVAEILKKFNYSDVKSASTPVDLEKPLVKDGDANDVDVHLYRSMFGSLMYLTTSRPDIMFAVCACARFQVTLKTSHLLAVKRIFRYLKGKPTLGLWYSRDSPFELVAYTDSDYAGATQDRKSTTRVLLVIERTLKIRYLRKTLTMSEAKNHILWDIITNGDQATTEPASSSGQPSAPKTSIVVNARRNNEKALNILLSAIPDRHLLSFHDAQDARSLWAAIKARFGGNKESKKMQKNLLKQQFETFVVGAREELDSAYERFQNIISMLELYDAKLSCKDANLKFLRSLLSVWHVVATMIRGQPGLDELDFDDLYNNLNVTIRQFQ